MAGQKDVLLYNNGACNSLEHNSVSCITHANSYTSSKILDTSRSVQWSARSINSNVLLLVKKNNEKTACKLESNFPGNLSNFKMIFQ